MATISDLRRGSEDERLAAIRSVVDAACHRIESGELDEPQARELAATIRFQVGLLIPEQMDTYDLIYGARFERLIEQFAGGGT